jgi:hypothetical protein
MLRIWILLSLLFLGCDRNGTGVSQALVDPNPILAAAVDGATHLEFRCGRFMEEEKRRVLITDDAEIRRFLSSIELESFPEGSLVHCYCDGDPHVIVQVGPGATTEFTIHHSSSIRWDRYETDLELTEDSKARLGEFLSRHRISSK